jgi:N-acetylmuramoyl-L-alanine amidase
MYNNRLQNYKITIISMHKTRFSLPVKLSFLFLFLAGYSVLAQKDASMAIKTVCIDAGHGGKDPGCHGGVANEKTVCLSMALKLGKRIKEAYPGINVVYTRDSDVFVELDDRAKIANKNKADLFVCIHANAGDASANGSETYVLGLHKTEAQQRIADRENSTIYLEDDKGSKYKDFDMSPDAIIARQLQLSIFLDQSISFASKLQSEFKRLGRYDRGVKQAGFLVLYKTTMPSVLIETGFLTNKGDEGFLKEDANQLKMAEAMFEAFKKYKNELEGVEDKVIDKKVVVAPMKEVKVEKQKEVQEEINVNSKIIFSVQIESSDKKLSLNSKKYEGIEVFEEQDGGLYKYLVGQFENDFEGATKLKNELRSKGFNYAFTVAYEEGKRINIEKGIRLAKKK